MTKIKEFLTTPRVAIPEIYAPPTCPDFETGFQTLFTTGNNESGVIKKEQEVVGRVYLARIKGLENWCEGTTGDIDGIVVVKNPSRSDYVRSGLRIGIRNGLVFHEGHFFAVKGRRDGFYVTRPVQAPQQAIFQDPFQKIVTETLAPEMALL